MILHEAWRQWRHLLLVCSLIFLAASFLAAEEIKNKAMIRAVRGNAEYCAGDQAWRKVSVNSHLQEGTILRTSKGSTVDLFLSKNGPVVRLDEDSEVRITALSRKIGDKEGVTKTKFELKSGRIMGMASVGRQSRYLIQFPAGIVEIKAMEGTHYSVHANGEVRISAGSAEVTYQVDGTKLEPVLVGPDEFVRMPKPGAVPEVLRSGIKIL